MKIITILLGLFLSSNTMAQNVDTSRKDTSKRIMIIDAKPIDKHDMPLYVVDGIIYKRNIRRINPNDILEITVLKGASAAVYGIKGANGVVLITTKRFQKQDTSQNAAFKDYNISEWPHFPLVMLNDKVYNGNLKDLNVKVRHIQIFKGPGASAIYGIRAGEGVILISSKRKRSKHYFEPSMDTTFNGSVIYINDGTLSEKNYINEKEILEKYVISGYKINGIDDRKLDSIVIIVTRKYAVKSYQYKLGTFSKDYKNYLEVNKNDDSGLVYLLNGAVLEGSQSEIIKKLHNKIEKIKTVDFIGKFFEKLNLNNPKPIVVITTKQ